jgi:ubiquitin-protein ligase
MVWFETNQKRFNDEMKILKRLYPKARIFIQDRQLTIYLKILGRVHEYMARIVYPNDFPYNPPKAYIIKPELPKLHQQIHRYSDGSLCLAKPNEIDTQITGKIICDWVRDWVRSYEIWLNTGKFPGGH